MHAVKQNHIECIPFLMKEVKMKDLNGWTALHHACYNGKVEAAKLLLEESAIENNEHNLPH